MGSPHAGKTGQWRASLAYRRDHPAHAERQVFAVFDCRIFNACRKRHLRHWAWLVRRITRACERTLSTVDQERSSWDHLRMRERLRERFVLGAGRILAHAGKGQVVGSLHPYLVGSLHAGKTPTTGNGLSGSGSLRVQERLATAGLCARPAGSLTHRKRRKWRGSDQESGSPHVPKINMLRSQGQCGDHPHAGKTSFRAVIFRL